MQTIPAEKEADEEEIYAEIRWIAEEHRPLCFSKELRLLECRQGSIQDQTRALGAGLAPFFA